MDKKSIEEKLNEMSEKMKDINAKIQDASDTVKIVGMESKDVLDKKVSDAKSTLAATEENVRQVSERGKSKLSSELIKAQMNLKEFKKAVEEKKAEHDKAKAEKEIEDTLEYAAACADLATIAGQEAIVAFLEAAEKKVEFDKEYGEEE